MSSLFKLGTTDYMFVATATSDVADTVAFQTLIGSNITSRILSDCTVELSNFRVLKQDGVLRLIAEYSVTTGNPGKLTQQGMQHGDNELFELVLTTNPDGSLDADLSGLVPVRGFLEVSSKDKKHYQNSDFGLLQAIVDIKADTFWS